MTHRASTLLLLPACLLALSACGRQTEDADVKFVGVGNHPDDIGPIPEDAGGLVEIGLMDMAGGGIPFGILGFISSEAIGPQMTGMAPPYEIVTGTSFLFDNPVPSPEAHFGSLGLPPEVEDHCWTNYEPFSFLTSSTVDVGSGLRVVSKESEAEFGFARTPAVYPPDPQDVFVYYFNVESHRGHTDYVYAPGDDDDPRNMTQQILRRKNFPAGEEVIVEFPGGIPPQEAPVSSIPATSYAAGPPPSFRLPNPIDELLLEWEGVTYDGEGNVVADAGSHQTCIQFLANEPEGLADCGGEQVPPNEEDTFPGQIYTGPWDTDDGQVTFRWTPGAEDTKEQVVLNVRFLLPQDPTNPYMLQDKVTIGDDANSDVQGWWSDDVSDGKVTGDFPQGYRDPLACEGNGMDYSGGDFTQVFNPQALEGDGDPVAHLRGDPNSTMAEVSCLLADDGTFELTLDHLGDALAYAERNDGAGGVLFFFSRKTGVEMPIPAVRNAEGFRQEVPDLQVRGYTTKAGRFWLEDDQYTSHWLTK